MRTPIKDGLLIPVSPFHLLVIILLITLLWRVVVVVGLTLVVVVGLVDY
jgi:hypothetical protein